MSRTKNPSNKKSKISKQKLTKHAFKLKYVVIPIDIFFSEELSWTEKLIYTTIEHLEDGNKGCWATNSYFAELLNKKSDTISKAITNLRRSGYISVEMDGNARSLRTTEGVGEKSYRGRRKILPRNTNSNKDTISKDMGATQALPPENKFITFWNNLPIVTTHKQDHRGKPSKTYKNISKKIKLLQSGNFNKSFKVDPNWMKKNNISKKYLTHKYTDQEVITILERLALMFDDDYWPPSHINISKSLDTLIYNRITRTSMFLMFAENTPRLLIEMTRVDKNPKMTKMAQTYLKKLKLSNMEKKTLIYTIRDLYKEWKRHKPYEYPVIFMTAYIEFLKQVDNYQSIFSFRPDSWQYRKFQQQNYNLY